MTDIGGAAREGLMCLAALSGTDSMVLAELYRISDTESRRRRNSTSRTRKAAASPHCSPQ